MNLTFTYLSLIYLTNSPFFADANKISFQNCQVSKSFNHFFFNSQLLYAQYSKFSHFLSSPIYYHSTENVTFQGSFYPSEHFYIQTDELYVSNCIFFNCKSDMSKGGAIFSHGCSYVNISNSHFIRCSSMIGCGAFYISSMDFVIESCCIESCHALFDQACYIQANSSLEVTKLGVIKCGLDGRYSGPCLEIHSYGFADLYYLNASHNSLKRVNEGIALLDFYTAESFANIYYSTINYNIADVALMVHDSWFFLIEDSNMVYNNISSYIFSVYDSTLSISKCCIGIINDDTSDHMPIATPYPTITEIPVPTAPPPPTFVLPFIVKGNSPYDTEILINQKSYKTNEKSQQQFNTNANEKQDIDKNKLSSKDQKNLDENINIQLNQFSSGNQNRRIIGPKNKYDKSQLIAKKNLYLKRKQQLSKRFIRGSSNSNAEFAQLHDSTMFTASFIFVEASTINLYNNNPEKILDFDDCFHQELIIINITEPGACSNISFPSISFDNYSLPTNVSKSAFQFPTNASSIAIIVGLCVIAIGSIVYIAVINFCPKFLHAEEKEQTNPA